MLIRFEIIVISVINLQHNWWDLVLVETHLLLRNYHVLMLYNSKIWLILYSFLAYCFILFWNHSFILVSPCQMLCPNCCLVFKDFWPVYTPMLFQVTFVIYCHWVNDSAGGPWLPEVICNPVAIMTWWYSEYRYLQLGFGL